MLPALMPWNQLWLRPIINFKIFASCPSQWLMFHCPICSCCETDFGFRFEKCSLHQEFLKLLWNQKISLTKTCCLKYLLSIYLNSTNIKPEAHHGIITVSVHRSLVFVRGNSIHYMAIKMNNNNNSQSLHDSPLLFLEYMPVHTSEINDNDRYVSQSL